jgi:hypothetical protein
MSVITIQDFSGMMPLRDGILLPDRNAQYARNTWLYKGNIRGFRQANQVYVTKYSDTQQVYRIPESTAEPPDFISSLWLEFPDPFMAVIRNPVVGDQWNRYYFFPSDQYSSTGANPDWPVTRPVPQYRTYDPTTNTVGPLLKLGIPTPLTPPGVVPAPISTTKTATAAAPSGSTSLTLNNTTNLSDGMSITDTTSATTVTHTTTAATNPSSVSPTYSALTSTSLVPTTISKNLTIGAAAGSAFMTVPSTAGLTVGMGVTNPSNPSSLSAGTIISVVQDSINITLSQNIVTLIPPSTSINFSSPAPNVLVLSNTAGATVGMGVTNNSNPSSIASGTTIISISGLMVTLSANVVSTVNAGDMIQCGNIASNVLAMNSVTGILVGMTITDNTNSNALIYGTTVTNVSGLNITMSQDVASSGVAAGDSIQFKNIVFPVASQIDTNGVASTTVVNMTTPTAGAGVLVGDTIQFDVTDIENRAYVYTYVSVYGEEGPASQPTNETGNPTGTWLITIPAPDPTTVAGYDLAKVRLYRTVTDSSGNAAYYQVTEFGPPFPTGVTNYSDSQTPQQIVSNSPLTSELYTPPPTDLQGVVMMANGIAAGWSNQREIWFSAAYLPHAWPASYAVTVDYPVVGITANGASLNIMCKGSPFIATGVTPDTMTIGRISSNEPCIGRGSIVSSGEGAYYASPNGVILLNATGTMSITEFVYEKEFHNKLQPWNWAAGHFGMQYVSFIKGAGLTNLDPDGLALSGFVLDRQDKNTPFCYLHFPATIKNMYFDEISGQLFELLSDGRVMQWNPPIGVPGTTTLWDWLWRSKVFRMAFPASFKAIKIIFGVPPEVQITLGQRNTDQNQTYNSATQYLIVKVFADGRFIMVKEVQQSEEILLIPDGFKATLWELELQGQVSIVHLKMATSVKELRKA